MDYTREKIRLTMLRRIFRVVFTVLCIVIKSNATLSFNAPSNILQQGESISVSQCDSSHDVKDVSVTSTAGEIPSFSITDSGGTNTIFGVFNNEQLRCNDRSALEAAEITSYTLTITVNSATEDPITFSFQLTITGLNANTPTFTPAAHSLSLLASRFDDEGQFSLDETFVVSDADPGAEGTVTCSLKDSPAEFDITFSSGTVSIQVRASTQSLASLYELVVLATDGGSPQKTGSATMTIAFTTPGSAGGGQQESDSSDRSLGLGLGLGLGIPSAAGMTVGAVYVFNKFLKSNGSTKTSSEVTETEKTETDKEKAEDKMEKGND